MLKIGEIEVTAISDGPFPAPLDSFVEFEREEVERLSGRHIDETVILPVNSYLLKLGSKLALVDTGCGPTMGPRLGQLPNNLRAIGVAPEAIDYVLLTHIHPDHALGLTDAGGTRCVSECGTDRARARSSLLARWRTGDRRYRTHPPQYWQSQSHDCTLS